MSKSECQHYETWGGEKNPNPDGWTYFKCDKCGYKWRSKTITEPVATPESEE